MFNRKHFMAEADILIVGAGINGLATSLELARRGLKVTVIDQGEPARESTWAGSGILCPLPPWNYSEDVNQVALRGMALFEDWARELHALSGVDPEFQRCGMAVLNQDAERALSWCEAHGLAAETQNCSRLCAELAPAPAIWLPKVASARNPRLARALLGACLKSGVDVLPHTPALTLLDDGHRIEGVVTPAGILQAERYVVAAGAWTGRLLGATRAGLDIWPQRGQILLFRAQPGQLPFVTLTEDWFYLVPRLDGLILAGTTREMADFDKQPTDAARSEIHRRAAEVMPALRALQPELHWAGLRPASPHCIPTVGRHPTLANLYANAGHLAYGVTEAPATAEHLAALLLDETPVLPAGPLTWR